MRRARSHRTMRHPAALVAALVLAVGAPRPAAATTLAPTGNAGVPGDGRAPRLTLSPAAAALIVTGAAALWGANALEVHADRVDACRWCEPGRFDLWARDTLRWDEPRAAASASDVLLLAVPLGSAAALAGLSARDAGWTEAFEDLALVAAALAVADPVNTGVKHATGRLRPQAWAAGGPREEADLHSFGSGHTSRVFAAAAATTQVARLRGRRHWKWLAAASFTGALATGWLRVGADQHWATDVFAGAAIGAAAGWAVPTLALGPGRHGARGPSLAPAPAGLAVRF